MLALALPLLTVAMLALVRPMPEPAAEQPPHEAGLDRQTLICPSAPDARTAGTVSVANVDGVTGEVVTRLPADDVVKLRGGTTRTGVRRALVATATSEMAVGLVAGRAGAGAAIACAAPASEQWFTGVGADPVHSSVLELVNPDGGPAVADVTVLGPDGEVDVPELRGVTIRGGRTARFDLAELAPTRDELALRVQVSRGRLGAYVLSRIDELGRGTRSSDWVPPQAVPATSSYLMGLGGKPGERTLVVANPGADEARVEFRLVGKDSEFVLDGTEAVRVAPGATAEIDLTDALRGKAAAGAIGLHLTSSEPVTSGLRTLAGDDLSFAVAGAELGERAAAVVPEGPARLVVTAGLTEQESPGRVSLVAYDQRGEEITRETVDLGARAGARVKLPADTAAVELLVENTSVVAAIESGPPGLAVLPLVGLQTVALVPDISPAIG